MTRRIEASVKAEILTKLKEGSAIGEICKQYRISRPTLNKFRKEVIADVDTSSEISRSSEDSETSSENSETSSYATSSSEDNNEIKRVFHKLSQLSDDEESKPKTQVGLEFINKHCKPEVKTVKLTPVKPSVKPKLKSGEVLHSEARESILRKIEAYLDAFPGKLAGFYGGKTIVVFIKSLQTKDHTYLQGMLEAMRFRVQNSGLGDSAILAFAFGTNAVETVGCRYGLKLKGFSRALQQNEAARQALKELSIEMLSDRAAKPHQRLALVIITTMYAVHSKNSLEEKTNEFLDQPLREPGAGMNPELLEEIRKINIAKEGV
jgi:hypothetical protein